MDLTEMMRKAQEMQSRFLKLQEDFSSLEFSGSSGGGMITAVITGKGIVKSINIADDVIKLENKVVLQDLLKTAINDAKEKSEEHMKTHGMPIDFMQDIDIAKWLK